VQSELDHRIASGDVPEALRGVLLHFAWDLRRLFALDLPHGRSDVADLAWHLDLPFWRENGVWFSVTPNEVRHDPTAHLEQWRRTLRTDLRYPIHVTEMADRTVVLDGVHRLLKATIEGRVWLPHRRLPTEMFPLIARATAARSPARPRPE
jgi:hypothetical protein